MRDKTSVARREKDFWGHQIPTLEESVAAYHAGPDLNTQGMLDSLEPLEDKTVLDFACGVGVTTAWLAARGANVTGIDITPEAIDQARQLVEILGLKANLECCDLAGDHGRTFPPFDRIAGKFALHHVDISIFAPLLAAHMQPGGVGSFLETTYSNPLLYLTRKLLIGHLGIVRLGTLDEKPIGRSELRDISTAFGSLRLELADMVCLRVLDRQLFRFKWPMVSKVCRHLDGLLYRSRHLHWLSYQRLLVVQRVA